VSGQKLLTAQNSRWALLLRLGKRRFWPYRHDLVPRSPSEIEHGIAGFHEPLRRFNARAGCVQEVIARWVWMALNDCGRMLRSHFLTERA
jgi:hypothetical protein